MGEAKQREAAEAAERAEWARDVLDDVLALEAEAIRRVYVAVGKRPGADALSEEEHARAQGLLTLAIVRSIGSDVGGVAASIEEAAEGPDEDEETDNPDGLLPESLAEPFTLVSKAPPRPAAPGILPE